MRTLINMFNEAKNAINYISDNIILAFNDGFLHIVCYFEYIENSFYVSYLFSNSSKISFEEFADCDCIAHVKLNTDDDVKLQILLDEMKRLCSKIIKFKI